MSTELAKELNARALESLTGGTYSLGTSSLFHARTFFDARILGITRDEDTLKFQLKQEEKVFDQELNLRDFSFSASGLRKEELESARYKLSRKTGAAEVADEIIVLIPK